MFRLERWSAGALLGSWVAYWIALISVSLGPGILRGMRLVRAKGNHGTMSLSFDGSRLLFDVHSAAGAGAWAFSSSIGTVVAWVAIPPLALWLVWLLSRPRRQALPAGTYDALPDPSLDAPLAQRDGDPEPQRSAERR